MHSPIIQQINIGLLRTVTHWIAKVMQVPHFEMIDYYPIFETLGLTRGEMQVISNELSMVDILARDQILDYFE